MFLVKGSIDNINRSIREATKVAHEDREKELATKNRVDISLNEYEELKAAQKENTQLKETLHNLLKPFIITNIPENTIRDILEGKAQFECKCEIAQDVMSLNTKLHVIYLLKENRGNGY